MVFLFPLTIAAFVLGYWPLRSVSAIRPESRVSTDGAPADGRGLRAFFHELQPILLVIVLGLGLGAVLTPLLEPLKLNISKELGLIASLLAAIGWVWHRNRLTGGQRRSILLRRDLLAMVYMVASIMIFEEILRSSQAAQAISAELIQWEIPLFSIAIILPMIVGLVCGITIAFVGTTFPILISLITSLGQGEAMLAYMMLAMVSGFAGVLFSPLHLCLMLSNQYFQTTLTAVYRFLLPPCIGLLITACIYFTALA